MSRLCKKIDETLISSGFFDSFDNVFTDCDGVLWMGHGAIPGSVEAIQALHKMWSWPKREIGVILSERETNDYLVKSCGKKIVYVTNNSTKAREDYVEICKNFGFPVESDNIFPASYCIAAFLKAKNFKKKVYIVGCSGIVKELDKVGIESLPIGPDPTEDDWMKWTTDLKLEPGVGAVCVGFDQHISFPKLTKAASYLKDPNCLFISANKDEIFPSDELCIPGAGTYVAAIERATGRESIPVGKPTHHMIDSIKNTHPDIDLGRTIMIGDRLNSDILMGTTNGIKTLLVLTGINSLEDVEMFKNSKDKMSQLQVPDYYLPRLGDLLQFIKN